MTGALGVYSKALTREAVWEAFRKRQVYGTSGPKIILRGERFLLLPAGNPSSGKSAQRR